MSYLDDIELLVAAILLCSVLPLSPLILLK